MLFVPRSHETKKSGPLLHTMGRDGPDQGINHRENHPLPFLHRMAVEDVEVMMNLRIQGCSSTL